MRLHQGLLHLAEVRWHEEFHATGDAEEDAGEDTCERHRNHFGRAKPGKYALNRVLHPLKAVEISVLVTLDAGNVQRVQ